MFKFSAALASFAVAANAWGGDSYDNDSQGLGFGSGGYQSDSFDIGFGGSKGKGRGGKYESDSFGLGYDQYDSSYGKGSFGFGGSSSFGGPSYPSQPSSYDESYRTPSNVRGP